MYICTFVGLVSSAATVGVQALLVEYEVVSYSKVKKREGLQRMHVGRWCWADGVLVCLSPIESATTRVMFDMLRSFGLAYVCTSMKLPLCVGKDVPSIA